MVFKILLPVVGLGGLGLLFGLLLSYASKKFKVERDPRIEKINDVLPGANCGGCGYPGCDGYASAVVAGEADIDKCCPGGSEVIDKIAEIMGVESVESGNMVARVMCQGDRKSVLAKYDYEGINDCLAASMLAGGPNQCIYGCIGLGSCVEVCPFGGVTINENGIAEINETICSGCGCCIEACPQNVIRLIPSDYKVSILCNSKDKGKDVKASCSVGCIGCGICARSCKFDAIKLTENIPIIDYDLCTGCMVCAEKCPTNAIYANFTERKIASIDEEKCKGCTLCKKECSFDAIEGNVKQPHKVLEDKCTGCGQCVTKCPFDAITLK